MKKMSKVMLAMIMSAGLLGASVVSADAFGGHGGDRMHRGDKDHVGAKGHVGLVPTELREQLRSQHQNLSEEERAQMHESHQAKRAEKRAAFEDFTGLSREELRERRQEGANIGDVLAEQGISEDEAAAFLGDRATERVNNIVEHHDLNAEQEHSIRDRVSDFVQKMLNRWFG